ncbi:unnamed protein product [Lactuca saligna]|uniref:Uncharacterized protein n=1 Tax=Lactuca saligna TaxID=75948 RepID=A0AA36E4S7_LACSI|nr:unnamed protein product [Lactuca saligna]
MEEVVMGSMSLENGFQMGCYDLEKWQQNNEFLIAKSVSKIQQKHNKRRAFGVVFLTSKEAIKEEGVAPFLLLFLMGFVKKGKGVERKLISVMIFREKRSDCLQKNESEIELMQVDEYSH